MAESKGDGTTVRISGEILDDVEEAIRQYPRGQRPTRGEMLAWAWRAYREASKQTKVKAMGGRDHVA